MPNTKPLLGPCDSLQLEPFEYPWAWDMAKECENNTWAPEEIQTAFDVSDYRGSLAKPEYRHVFEALMAQLTTFDIQRGDDAGEILLGLLQPAEIRHFLKRLIWEEALHTRSYRYIIENLGMDLEIYDRWKTVPAMKARIDFAIEISDRLLDIRVGQLGGRTKWIAEEKQTILYALIFWFYIFEGIWFMLNLKGPIQHLARLGYFKGAAEQFQYIAKDEEQHVRFGHKLVEAFIQQYPETWTEAFKQSITILFHKAIQLEADYAAYFLSAGPIVGYPLASHVSTAQFFANLKARSLGLPDPFPGAQHCFPWMSESTELKKEKNFFETRVTEYKTGGALKWD